MSPTISIFKRECLSFFATPIGYVFITIFLSMSGVFTFYFGDFYQRGQADLIPFFSFHPWLYLFLVPAIAMRTWAEERKSGTIELLMTLPVTTLQVLLGKFLATWAMVGVALGLTFPMWVTVNYLGNPDNGIIVAAYVGSWLMAGAFLAVSVCMSAFTKNQVVAFVLSVMVCFFFVLSGSEILTSSVQAWMPAWMLDTVASFSFLTHFEDMSKGVIVGKDVGYFLIVIGVGLYASWLVIETKKAD